VSLDAASLWNLAVATLGGLAVGIERQWSGHAVGPRARFAGLRTFTLLGLVAGLSGLLWVSGLQGPAIVFLAGLGALVVVAYLAASRHDVDGTTEVAAFVVMAAGVLAGAGHDRVASGIVALTVLLLLEKKRLHGLVSLIERVEVRAASRFAVMATVVLPLLPEGPFGPLGGVRPRQLWALVLFFSGLSFVGYIARRTAGPRRGYAIAGTLGGVLSSTAVTLTFARLSRSHPQAGRALASGALGGNAVLFPRVLIGSSLLAPALTRELWPAFVLPTAIGAGLAVVGLRDAGHPERIEREKNPLQFKAALQMAALFQVVLYVSAFAEARFGQPGLYGSAALLGLVDMDALTISMSQLTQGGTNPGHAATAVTIGVIANTLVKLGVALAVGRGSFRPRAVIGLALMALALGATLMWTS
jgi:uncharacterized membrane protein (DUF4010 family)